MIPVPAVAGRILVGIEVDDALLIAEQVEV
jgi:hypothetical protein